MSFRNIFQVMATITFSYHNKTSFFMIWPSSIKDIGTSTNQYKWNVKLPEICLKASFYKKQNIHGESDKNKINKHRKLEDIATGLSSGTIALTFLSKWLLRQLEVFNRFLFQGYDFILALLILHNMLVILLLP